MVERRSGKLRGWTLCVASAAIVIASSEADMAHGKKAKKRAAPAAVAAKAEAAIAGRDKTLQLPIIVAPGGGGFLTWSLTENNTTSEAAPNLGGKLRADVYDADAKILVYPEEVVQNPPVQAQWVSGALQKDVFAEERTFKIVDGGSQLTWSIDDKAVQRCESGELLCKVGDLPPRLWGFLKTDPKDKKLVLVADYGKGPMKIKGFTIEKR